MASMRIPSHAKRVFSGIIYDVYQWEQEQFDGSFRTFEAIKRPESVQVIAFDGERIIIAKEQQPGKSDFFGFIGGRVEDGEDPLTAAKRELLEETGLGQGKWQHFKTIEATGNQEWFVHVFFARDLQQVTPELADTAGERIELLKLTLEEFAQLLVQDEFRSKLVVDHLINQCNAQQVARQLHEVFDGFDTAMVHQDRKDS